MTPGSRLRNATLTGVTLAVLLYLLGTEAPADVPDALHQQEEEDPGEKLRIQWMHPVQLSPGAATVMHLKGAQPDLPVTAAVSKVDARVLRRDGTTLVVQVPKELPPGPAKVRVFQGDRRSKPRLLQLRPVPLRNVLGSVIGGLALFVLGLRTVGSALRSYAGQGVRTRLSWLTRTPVRGVSVGAMVGGLTQSTTSSAGLLVGLLDARLLSVQTGAVIMVGAHLGAALTGALLPLAATRDALWLIALGMMWVALSENRRARALANIALGCGLLFYGLRLLQLGFQPLVADPQMLPYVSGLHANSPLGALACMAAGAALCGLLQGPGPVFALVASMAQSSGLIGLSDGIAILSGTAVGAAVGTSAVGWPYGRAGRTLALTHVLLGATMALVALLGVPAWASLAESLVAGDATAVDYGGRTLHPNMAMHLGVGFGLSQLAAALVALVARPALGGLVERWMRARVASGEAPPGGLEPALRACRTALESVTEITRSDERQPGVTAERALQEARSSLEQLLAEQSLSPHATGAATACLHLTGTIDTALSVAERGLERNLRASPAQLRTLESLQHLLLDGLDEAIDHATRPSRLELESAQAREIRLNALEAEARRELAGATEGDVPGRLWLGELLVAYETIGNHVYRVLVALSDEAP